MAFKYRADQVGSLLRPKELLEAIRSGVAAEKLKELEDQQILRVLGRQKDLGFKIFSDGEFRRRGFMSDFHDSVSGLDMQGAIDRNWQNCRRGRKWCGRHADLAAGGRNRGRENPEDQADDVA